MNDDYEAYLGEERPCPICAGETRRVDMVKHLISQHTYNGSELLAQALALLVFMP